MSTKEQRKEFTEEDMIEFVWNCIAHASASGGIRYHAYLGDLGVWSAEEDELNSNVIDDITSQLYQLASGSAKIVDVTPPSIRAGDHIKHHPSGETWLVATDEEDGMFYAAGWPETRAYSRDCTIIKPATDEKRIKILTEVAESKLRSSLRRSTARRQLHPESLAHELTRLEAENKTLRFVINPPYIPIRRRGMSNLIGKWSRRELGSLNFRELQTLAELLGIKDIHASRPTLTEGCISELTKLGKLEGEEAIKIVVLIESPFAGDMERNQKYARLCMLDSLERGEAPIVPHLLYPQVWDDLVPELREQALLACEALREASDIVAFYTDLGMSPGMQRAELEALASAQDIHYRTIHKTEEQDNEDV